MSTVISCAMLVSAKASNAAPVRMLMMENSSDHGIVPQSSLSRDVQVLPPSRIPGEYPSAGRPGRSELSEGPAARRRAHPAFFWRHCNPRSLLTLINRDRVPGLLL